MGACQQCRLPVGAARQHEHGVNPGIDPKFDVGIEPVAYHQDLKSQLGLGLGTVRT